MSGGIGDHDRRRAAGVNTQGDAQALGNKRSLGKEIFSKKMLTILFLGFSSGLPLLLIGSTLKTWLAREHVDVSTIGYFSWVGLAYSLKFLWSPLLDRYTLLPMGRRRSWMLITQIVLAASIAGLGMIDPKISLGLMAAIAVLVGIFSATQDIAIDAYRRELLSDEELGLGASITTYGYRIAMLVSGGLGIGLVGATEWWNITWSQLYFVMAALMLVGVVTTFLCPEPKVDGPPPRTLMAAVIDPLTEFFQRPGAWTILLFILFYKLGDAVGGAMMNPLYVEVGYSNLDIGLVAKTFGLATSLLGLFMGGVVIYYIGIYRSLWIFGIMQAVSTAAFALLTFTGPKIWALASVVAFEDISTSMATAAFLAFMGALSNKKYTATQYAVLSSLATVGRNFFSGFSGDMVKHLQWAPFFYVCGLMAIPGLIMLWMMRKHHPQA